MVDKNKEGELRVLLYDLETSPNLVWTWGVWEQNAIKVVIPRQIISFSWKWLGEKEVHTLALSDTKSYKAAWKAGKRTWFDDELRNNRELMTKLHDLFMEADVTIGHNVEQFDDKRTYTDFVKNKLAPVPPHRRVDTLKFARSKFDFNSNKLDDLGEFLGLGRKVKHPGFEMWNGCMNGDKVSWAQLKLYNAGDVVLLENIYLLLRPWMAIHPNMNAGDGNLGCPKCRGKNMDPHRRRMTQAGQKLQYRCRDCWSYCTVLLEKPSKKSAVSVIRKYV